MATITIELPSEGLQKLQEMAQKFGVSMEELVRVSVEDMLTQPEEQFRNSAQYVLKKNAELYKRLAA
ncbi:ribbon-helix-helix protein, CopG family [Candidatus Villigracilis saccharophilus]|uniref:ribbon-helix-helix protein, CopG family n=1 Tax=Candidatus Villigracilis saccharophilus TaxID=3140684 RepID=UPI003134D2B3|nr:ribbon-helix-helix protein, CopG family [Anaerolineales bacterium]